MMRVRLLPARLAWIPWRRRASCTWSKKVSSFHTVPSRSHLTLKKTKTKSAKAKRKAGSCTVQVSVGVNANMLGVKDGPTMHAIRQECERYFLLFMMTRKFWHNA